MARTVVVGTNSYTIPDNRDSAGWGATLTDWMQAVSDTLASLSGASDIQPTPATIANNQAVAANITSLSFDPTTVRGAIIEYTIYRVSTGPGANERTETGLMYLGYKSTAATWDLVVTGGGTSGVTFSVTSGGQFQYTSDDLAGGSTPSTYSGTIKFRARSLTI